MKIIITILTCLFLYNSVEAQTINPAKSYVSFAVSNMKFNTVDGHFSGMKGTVKFNSNDLAHSSFNVCMDAATVNTDNNKRDNHLRTEDFFYVSKFPAICFVSDAIVKDNSGYKAKGKLTLHGVTKEVEIPFTFSNKTFEGNFEINRLDYGVGKGTGKFMVGNNIKVLIVCAVN